jgi:CTP synthase
MIESSSLEEETKISDPTLYADAWSKLKSAQGILVPGGFGVRGIEGKVEAVRYARENKIPFLGICLGMQAAVIEYTRSFLDRPVANSREFEPDSVEDDAAIIFMPEGSKDQMGGTMRLGARTTVLQSGSIAAQLYDQQPHISERHRHRYEVNPNLVQRLEAKGLTFSGKDETQVYICMYVNIYIYIYIYVCIYVCIHTYIYTEVYDSIHVYIHMYII